MIFLKSGMIFLKSGMIFLKSGMIFLKSSMIQVKSGTVKNMNLERRELHAELVPCNDPWTAAHQRRSEWRFCRTDLANDRCLWEPKLLLRVGNRAAGACVASSPDSNLEAFSHNPAHGSFAPLAFQPSAMTNCANQQFLSF
ncbi:hypothetical protein YC2023_108276 [Brassica napus]